MEYIASIDNTTYDRYIVWIESSECDVGSSTLAEFIDGKLQNIDSKITEFMKSKTLGAEVVINQEVEKILKENVLVY